jgi:uncharacterized damage-inducible protein DinB
MPHTNVGLVLTLLDQAFDRKSWHGTNLRGSIRGLDVKTAAWRPAPNRHNIWETVIHTAYWKYTVRRRILGEKRGSFPIEGSNWFVRPEGDDDLNKAWKRDVALLVDMHRSLRESVESLDDRALGITPAGSKVSNLDILLGIASHDLHHAGQIQLLKRLAQG